MHGYPFLYLIVGSLTKLFHVEQVDTDKISLVVGPGGKTIRGIIESSGVESVDVSDDGSVSFPSFLGGFCLIRVCLDYVDANFGRWYSL